MGNVIPWSKIDPSIKSREAFVGVVVIDPQRKLCVSEILPLEEEMLSNPQLAARQVIALAQQGTARVARAYHEKARTSRAKATQPVENIGVVRPKLQVVRGGLAL
jgi:hypothetical protein